MAEADHASLADRVVAHCRATRGATIDPDSNEERIGFKILGEFLGTFARVTPGIAPTHVALYASPTFAADLTARNVAIEHADRVCPRGSGWYQLPLDGTLAIDELCAAIDHSFQIVMKSDRLESWRRATYTLLDLDMTAPEFVESLCAATGIPHLSRTLVSLLRDRVELIADTPIPGTAPVGASRLGGQPDLPADVAWPVVDGTELPMSFILQLDLAELHQTGVETGFPPTGLLQVFSRYALRDERSMEEWGLLEEMSARGPACVRIESSPASALAPRTPPEGVDTYDAHTITLRVQPQLPSMSDPMWTAIDWRNDDDEFTAAEVDSGLDAYVEARTGRTTNHWIGGHARYVQSFHATELYESSPDYRDDATFAFQLGWDPTTGMMWDDGGVLYFCGVRGADGYFDLPSMTVSFQTG